MIKNTLLLLFQKKQTGTKVTIEQINELFDCGVITEKSALRYIVKSEYEQMIIGTDISHRSAVMDLSIRWDIGKTTIENIIYKTPSIKPIRRAY